MGIWHEMKEVRNIVAYENSRNKVDIQEWDCFDMCAMAWKKYFEKMAKSGGNIRKIDGKRLTQNGDIFDEAMNITGSSTPPAKLSGGNCTIRAVELFNKYGGGGGPTYEEAMREGLSLANGNKSKYPTKTYPKGTLTPGLVKERK